MELYGGQYGDAAVCQSRCDQAGRCGAQENAGFINLSGNLFDSAIMKTSVISETFRATYLSDPNDPNAFEGRAVVFDGPDDFHKRIDDPVEAIDATSILVMRGTGRLATRAEPKS